MANYVNVTALGINADGTDIQSGELVFTPSDIVWSTAYGLLGAIQPVTFTWNGGESTLSVNLYAMDNAGVSTNWTWIITGNIEGVPMLKRSLSVLFASGPTQNLATLLQASTVVT